MSKANARLLEAAQNDDIAEIRAALRSKAKVNCVDLDDRTPLYWAASHGYDDVIKVLLDNGASVHAGDYSGATPLHAASSNSHIKAMRVLLNGGADANSKNAYGVTPLEWAVGDVEAVELLLAAGARVNEVNALGSTPLLAAAALRHSSVVKLLLAAGADATVVEHNTGRTPASSVKGLPPWALAILGPRDSSDSDDVSSGVSDSDDAFSGDNGTESDGDTGTHSRRDDDSEQTILHKPSPEDAAEAMALHVLLREAAAWRRRRSAVIARAVPSLLEYDVASQVGEPTDGGGAGGVGGKRKRGAAARAGAGAGGATTSKRGRR